uniref:RxLR effector candidate protein n=1 Tax=Hyaloperonospora arabidopsidis (strain Emoy2) TaxID=559515 RepID=M4B6W5_HYAAE
MGLGKTLQVIAFLAALVGAGGDERRGEGGRYLVIAPLSVLPTWMEQFEQYAPSISTAMFIGLKKDREAVQSFIAGSSQDKPLVIVTSYEMFLYEHEFLNKTVWKVMIMDEGHRLKNPKGQLYGIVSTRLRSEYRVILTGTPIQNNLDELFALLSILNPSIFRDRELFNITFRDYFSVNAQRLDGDQRANLDHNNKAEKLMQRLLAPLLLLRTVQDVQVVHTPMSAMQRAYYKEVIVRNSEALNEPEPFKEGSHLYENSGKLFVLHQILPRLKHDGHRVLLFSQSPPFLDIIQDYLTLESFAYERIDGSVRGKERWQCIERFQKDPETFVFLISTRAGGLGLNLQSADTVIFVDSDYNPHTDLQAVARAYRLGQTKPIHVIKFLCANTVEESIYRRALRKMRMADRIRNLARRTNCEQEVDDDGATSLLDMIQFGLHRLMEGTISEKEDALIKPLNEDYIQHILSRKSACPIEDTETSLDNEAQCDKLLESGGDFQEGNMYYFEGEDYTKVVSCKTRDAELLQKWCTEAASYTKRQTKMAQKKKYEQDEVNKDREGEEDKEQSIENEAERARQRQEQRQQSLERKLAQWKANKYTSAVIDIDTEQYSSRASDAFTIGRLYYKSGDASQPPQSSLRERPYVVVQCVNNSGVWCSRGFFRALSLLSPVVQKQYEAAGRNNDLKLGSAHLIPLPSHDATNSPAFIVRYVCLLVVQACVGRKKQRVAKGLHTVQLARRGKSSNFRLHALETALQALAHRCLELGATVHLPRIGYGTPNFNWYTVERLLVRNLRDVGVEATIYYYSAR